MLITNKKIYALLCMSAVTASVLCPSVVHADPYHSTVRYYGTVLSETLGDKYDANEFIYTKDANGLTWRYTKNYDDTVTIEGLKDRVENVVVPETLDGYKVTCISHMPIFKESEGIEVKEVKSIKIPEGVKRIGEYAFGEYVNLENIEIPKSATDITYESFMNTKWIKNQKYDENNCLIINGILLDANITDEKFEVPNNVLAVGKAFLSHGKSYESQNKVKEIKIPDTVIEVRQKAFEDCKELKKVVFEGKKTYVEPYAFSNCPKLTEAELPVRNKITTYAFRNTPIFKGIVKNMKLEDGISTLPEKSSLHDQKELELILSKDYNKLLDYCKNKNKV